MSAVSVTKLSLAYQGIDLEWPQHPRAQGLVPSPQTSREVV